MRNAIVGLIGALFGGVICSLCLFIFLDWGRPDRVPWQQIDPSRGDYVDLLLTLVTVLLAAVGIAVTVGAVAIGLVAFKTLSEIKSDASKAASQSADEKIQEAMANELQPAVYEGVTESLPDALKGALLDDDLAHKILEEMAERGELDEVLERVVMRVQSGGPEYSEEEDN